jgi:autotransporter-associated beta strand protein
VGAFTNAGGTVNGSGTITASGHWLQSGTVNASLGGSSGLTKSGAGTATLTAANSYSGNTTINQGTLALTGSGAIPSSSVINIASGAFLDVSAISFSLGASQTIKGNGTVVGSVTANGTVAPGSSIGTLTFNGALALAGATQMELDRAGAPNADLISATSIVEGGTLTVVNIGGSLLVGDSFNLFDGTLSSSFTTVNLPSLDAGLDWDVSDLGNGGTLTVIGVPEPSTLACLGVGLTALVLFRRRK